jgi:hypothetical protein
MLLALSRYASAALFAHSSRGASARRSIDQSEREVSKLCSMIPHKTPRGQEALKRIQCCEGVPAEWQKSKRMVVPDCLKIVCLQHGHRFCKLGDLSAQVLFQTPAVASTRIVLLLLQLCLHLRHRHRHSGCTDDVFCCEQCHWNFQQQKMLSWVPLASLVPEVVRLKLLVYAVP